MSDSSSFLDNYLGNTGGSLSSSFGDRGDYFSGLRGQVFGGQLGASEGLRYYRDNYQERKTNLTLLLTLRNYQRLLFVVEWLLFQPKRRMLLF